MISPDPHHNPDAVALSQRRHAEALITEPDEARARLGVLQLTVAPARANLETLEHALYLETNGKARPARLACLSQAVKDLQAKL